MSVTGFSLSKTTKVPELIGVFMPHRQQEDNILSGRHFYGEPITDLSTFVKGL